MSVVICEQIVRLIVKLINVTQEAFRQYNTRDTLHKTAKTHDLLYWCLGYKDYKETA